MSLVADSLRCVLENIDSETLDSVFKGINYETLVRITESIKRAKKVERKYYFIMEEPLNSLTVKCIQLFYPKFVQTNMKQTDPVIFLCVSLLGLDDVEIFSVKNNNTLSFRMDKVNDFSNSDDEYEYRRYNYCWLEDLTHSKNIVTVDDEIPEEIPDRPSNLFAIVSAFAKEYNLKLRVDDNLPETGPYRVRD